MEVVPKPTGRGDLVGYAHIYLSLILTLGQEPLLVQYADRIQAEKGRLDQIPEGKHFVILILKLNETKLPVVVVVVPRTAVHHDNNNNTVFVFRKLISLFSDGREQPSARGVPHIDRPGGGDVRDSDTWT